MRAPVERDDAILDLERDLAVSRGAADLPGALAIPLGDAQPLESWLPYQHLSQVIANAVVAHRDRRPHANPVDEAVEVGYRCNALER
ncbi:MULTISPECIES: hypothetical protein [Sinorhizobium]|uniref:Uncharacterized protein n=1 Tax=Sinorhizobium glycinis TaxID=1472378 RepID=A0A178XLP8_9HYPH|nr:MULTISPECIES: hypothetical protein [Sinorhizobium]KSV83945.1 hypothetical protein N181_24560 [Sinorhizobium fredii USDA 205]OAP35652.1 hypothetical protein AU381_12130 [Sinorhizobium glycinis]